MAMDDNKIMMTSMATATKEPTRAPEIRSQKALYCGQIANQLALEFPLCAKYTMAAEAEAPALRRLSIPYIYI